MHLPNVNAGLRLLAALLAVACTSARAHAQTFGDLYPALAKLVASDGAPLDFLGWSVSISGDTMAVGAPYDTVGANTQQEIGRAHV